MSGCKIGVSAHDRRGTCVINQGILTGVLLGDERRSLEGQGNTARYKVIEMKLLKWIVACILTVGTVLFNAAFGQDATEEIKPIAETEYNGFVVDKIIAKVDNYIVISSEL
jgi:hypothetical protein